MKHSIVNTKFSLIISLAVHILNLYSTPFSNLYTFSNVFMSLTLFLTLLTGEP